MKQINVRYILITLVIGILFSQIKINAQVTVVIQQPPPYQFKLEHLWKVTLINQTNTTYKVYLKGTATEWHQGKIVSGTTASFSVPPGVKVINPRELVPMKIEINNNKYANVIQNINAVPTGDYEICVSVINAANGSELGKQCIETHTQNLSQIELLQPENGAKFSSPGEFVQKKLSYGTRENDTFPSNDDYKKISPGTREGDTGDVVNEYKKISPGTREGDTVWTDAKGNVVPSKGIINRRSEDSTNYKTIQHVPYGTDVTAEMKQVAPPILTFSWLPPSPIPPGVKVTYALRITEIFGNQSPYDAVLSNPAFFINPNIYSNVFLYPLAGRKFQNNKRYAWKVIAFFDKVLVSESETYEFIFMDNTQKNVTIEKPKAVSPKTKVSNLYFKKILLASLDNSQIPEMIFENSIENGIKPFVFSGSAKLSFDAGYKKLPFSELPNNTFTTELNPSVTIYELPFTANVLLSTQQGSDRQNINSFSFNFDINTYKEKIKSRLENEISEKATGWEKLLLSMNSFGIGTNYPSYTDWTLKGVPVTGINFELNPGIFYAAFAASKNMRGIENIAYERNLYAGRIGIGKKENTHIFFTGLYVKDDENSTTVSTDNLTLTPKANYVFGSETKLALFNEHFLIEGEGNVSVLTRDTRDADLENSVIPGWLKGMITPKISTSFDYSYTGKMSFNNPESATKISFGLRMVGPGFTSLGVPNLRNDLFAYEAKAEQGFLSRKIFISSYFRLSHDNLIDWKSSRTTTTAYGINLGLNFPKLPFLQLSYSPYLQKNDNQIPQTQIENKTVLISAVTGYALMIKQFNFLTTVVFTGNEAKSLNGLSDYSINSISITEAISFDKPISFIGTWGLIKTNSPLFYSNINNFDFSINASFIEILSNTLGFNVADERFINKRTGIYLNTIFSPLENINLSARVEGVTYANYIDSGFDYNELIFNLQLNIIW